ncbi:hypothetical protein ABIB62_001553 [Mucilaginibacter sp. UYP25]|uniref:DUF1801 domain-containing protein n=1 Tax=unclassified Mucilaginibacter TaxID=2617802 RepID=UPI00339942C3
MQTPTLESYYLTKPEPYQSCLLALRDIILRVDGEVIHERKFQIPFFTYRGKKLAYLWLDRKKLKMGFCLDKSLQPIQEGIKPKDQYESILIDPNEDFPVELILQKLSDYINQIKTDSLF